MFRIESISEDAAEGKVKAVYDEIRDSMGIVPNVFKVMSLCPEGLEFYAAMVKTMMLADSKLTRAVKEMIASTVSRVNQCDYCLGHHKYFMTQYGVSSEISEQIVDNPQSAAISEGEKKLLGYVEIVTRHANRVSDQDIVSLKESGWTQEQILEATLVAALFNAINRIADALGVEPEA